MIQQESTNAELLRRMAQTSLPPAEQSSAPQQENVGITDMPSLGPVGTIASAAGKYGLSQIGHVPAMTSMASSGLSSMAAGSDAEKSILDAIASGATDLAGSLLEGFAPGYGGKLAGLISSGLRAPGNLAAAFTGSTLKTLAATLGNMGLPVLGGMLASAAAGPSIDKSLSEGYLGDWTDNRSLEPLRDKAEDMGYSVDNTSLMATSERLNDAFGVKGKTNPSLVSSFTDVLGKNVTSPVKEKAKKLSDYLARAALADKTQGSALSHELSTTQGAQAYGERMGKNFDDADTAMSEARGLAGLDSIGSLDGRGESDKDGASGGDVGGSQDSGDHY